MWPFVLTAHAAVDDTIRSINKHILNPLIVFMFALAAVYFAYGVFQYVRGADKPDAREIGKQHIIWGLVGMFIMVAVRLIMNLIVGTLGIEGQIDLFTGEAELPPIQ